MKYQTKKQVHLRQLYIQTIKISKSAPISNFHIYKFVMSSFNKECRIISCIAERDLARKHPLPARLEEALSELWFAVEQQPTLVQHQKDNLGPEIHSAFHQNIQECIISNVISCKYLVLKINRLGSLVAFSHRQSQYLKLI